jgi:DNA adenine methylase
MQQLPLFPDVSAKLPVVNVASVPQRSPFRYPGGKTWLVPVIRQWLGALNTAVSELVEPFAGGSSIGLTAAFEGLAAHITLIEIDDDIAAVWETIIQHESDARWLAEQILHFDLTVENVEALLAKTNVTRREQALRTLIRNRVNRGGILAPGAGRVKQGEDGKGIKSRWYPQTLHRRILNIVSIREQLSFIQGDGLAYLQTESFNDRTAFFIDPPYTAAGKRAGSRLYRHMQLDHERLFDAVHHLPGEFMMTYDNNPVIAALATQHGFETREVAMKNTHHARMSELLIARHFKALE